MCKYSYYDESNSRKPMYCSLNNKPCIYSQYCVKVGRYIDKEGMENCFMALQELKKNIPNGANFVRFIDDGYLYVEIDNRVIKIKDTLGNVTNYVYLKYVNDEYKISLKPFEKQQIKKTTRVKKNA